MKKKVIALALCLVMLLTGLGMSGDMIDSLVSDPAEPSAPVETTVPADAEPVSTEPLETEPVETEPVPPDPGQPLYDRLMSCETSDEFKAVAEEAGDEAIAALSESELNALMEHYSNIYVPVMPETVVFTDAGPFMPAVTVEQTGVRRLMKAAAKAADDNNGLVTGKTAVKQSDGSYKISIEVYATGTVTTTTSVKPVDIVLVLDQSGSMAYNFAGDSTNTNSDRRQYAMKQAVKNFIDEVNNKYDPEKSDHRLAIVTFGSSASTLLGWTNVDEAGATTLKGKIGSLPDSPSGATNIAAGMTQAETLMGSGYNYTGSNTERQKVVIVFTDGVPTTGTEFDKSVANSALNSSKNLKDAGATVYSVGIFNGANVAQLYGEKWAYTFHNDIICTGEVGSYWGGSWLQGIIGNNDFDSLDIPAVNRFLNYISNNFAAANEIGITKGSYNPGDHSLASGTGWKIEKNFDRTSTGYYLTANNADSLANIFTQISQNIGSTSVTLDSNAVVRDVVTPYFDMPDDANNISVKTYACKGKSGEQFSFDPEGKVLTNAVTINNETNTIDVSGFDFKSNYVRDKDTGDGNGLGKKLVIEFTVKPKAEFWGGNKVPTNGDTSGIYENKDSTEAVRLFDVPKVDVPIKAPYVEAVDKDIYLLGTVPTASELYTFKAPANDSWQTEFVNITAKCDEAISNTEDGNYNITVTVSPKYDGTADSKTAIANAKVNVFKPEVTFKDSAIDLGQTPNYEDDNLVSVEWKHGDIIADVSEMGAAPSLTYEYDPTQDAFKTDTSVEVTQVRLNGKNVREHAKFVFGGCDYKNCEDNGDWKFIVHIKTFDLTITKMIANSESKLYGSCDFIFNVKGNGIDMDVVVNVPAGETIGSVTIKGLPVGTYTITEDTGWSWRYELNGVTTNGSGTVVYNEGNSADYTPSGTNNNIIFTNDLVKTKWLSFVNSMKNFFGMEDNA